MASNGHEGSALRIAAYRRALDSKLARSFFARSVPGRFGAATISLAITVFVRSLSGSYQLAGVAAGIFALCNAVGAPLTAYVASRLGQARVLGASAAILIILEAATLFVASAGTTHNSGLLLVCIGLTGAAMPQIGAVAVSRWSFILTDASVLRAAFALESMMNEITFLAGPALISAAVVLMGAPAAPCVAIGLVATSALLLAAARESEPPTVSHEQSTRRTKWRIPGSDFAAVAVASVSIGGFFGATQVSVIAEAAKLGSLAISSTVYAAMSATSLIAGLVYGGMKRDIREARWDLAISFGALVIGSCCLTFANSLLGLVGLLLACGVFVAPLVIASSVIAVRSVDKRQVNQAFTILTSLSGLGSALGSSLAGVVIDTQGATHGFSISAIISCGGLAAALLIAVMHRRLVLEDERAGRSSPEISRMD